MNPIVPASNHWHYLIDWEFEKPKKIEKLARANSDSQLHHIRLTHRADILTGGKNEEGKKNKSYLDRIYSFFNVAYYSQDMEVSEREKMSALGFKRLYDTLHHAKGFPWNEIKKIESNEIKQQLLDLYEVSSERERDAAFPLIFEMQPKYKTKSISLFISKIIYLIENKIPVEWNKETIEKSFNAHLEQIKNGLLQTYSIHKNTKLQSLELALARKKCKEVAQLLILSNGSLNFGLIPHLIETFIGNEIPNSHSADLKRGLLDFYSYSLLRESFEAIKQPIQNLYLAEELIKIDQNIPWKNSVMEKDVKKSIMTAMLSHLRQGKVGSCFATFLAIMIHRLSIKQTMTDLAGLVEEGYIRRTIKGKEHLFPLLLRMNNFNFNKKVKVDLEGKIISSKGAIMEHLWKAPGISAACNAVSLDNPKAAIKQIIAKKQQANEPFIELSLAEWISEITNLSPTFLQKKYLEIIASFAFESEVENPLLHVWENSIADMAECENPNNIKHKVLDSLKIILMLYIEKKLPFSPAREAKSLIEKYLAFLEPKMEFFFDPFRQNGSLSNDQHSREGAFIMYLKERSNWKKVETAATFIQALKETLSEWQKTLPIIGANFAESLKLYATSDEFLTKLICHYNPQNLEFYPDIMSKLEEIRQAPWLTITGNDPIKVLKTYFHNSENPLVLRYKPDTIEGLLKKYIEITRRYSRCQLIPVGICGQHIFLGFSQPHLLKINTAQYVQKILSKTKEIAQVKASASLKNVCMQFCRENFLDVAKRKLFDLYMPSLGPVCTIQQMRNKLLHLVNLVDPSNKSKERKILFDTFLANHLLSIMPERLKETMVPFGDTIWASGIHDLHFYFFANPGTGRLEVCEIRDDLTNIRCIDQNEWILNHEWIFIPLTS